MKNYLVPFLLMSLIAIGLAAYSLSLLSVNARQQLCASEQAPYVDYWRAEYVVLIDGRLGIANMVVCAEEPHTAPQPQQPNG